MADTLDRAHFWDERFSNEDYVFGTEPNAFLKREAHHIPNGSRVLAVADGEGRNGVFLAEQGCDVVSTDISEKGLAKAQRLADERDVSLQLEQVDLAQYDWPENTFDAVAAIFIQFAAPELRERIFEGIRRTLKPGGVLLLEGYRPKQLDYGTGGPPVAENMYTEALLREAFEGWDIVKLESYDAEIHEGSGHGGMSALIDLVARRPA
ncbi:class I SAM-dependent methyltransferase [Stakelama marina]|uniref:Methyltransferase domain-containing protein n=1 Tax=Stakelama marina TaxID=2826939 RepID=A0A8T4IED7_9SPHN|nr:class I SAM-dependent methyltransferase [Stakelama marina]MBR0552811.1 methyltransferase domain-containing protein [Stakelama marina]